MTEPSDSSEEPEKSPAQATSGKSRVPPISRLLWLWFSRYSARFVKGHFHAVRLNGGPPPQPLACIPLIVCLNHPSWWDPLACILLAQRFWPDRRHFGPIDAKMLAKYRFFRKLGFFGVEPNSARGGVQFLRAATDILSEPSTVIWLTAEGEFADVRRRPVCLRPGLAHLLRRVPEVIVVPVALEYAFWGERTPELLVRVGRPVITKGRKYSASRWNAMLTARLQRTMDELAELSMSRDGSRFVTILGGVSGSSAIYDLWRWVKARIARRPFSREHMTNAPESALACGRMNI